MIKRLFDIFFSAIGLLVLAPVLLTIAAIIKFTSDGPVVYRGTRVGKNGIPFKMFKFRTMVINADRIGGPLVPDSDPRITKVGLYLRKYKLDELPQLLNVLKGEMSFVGPRPEVQEYVEMYSEEEKAVLSVRPGITDWASLWDSDEGAILANSNDPEKTYREFILPNKLKLQLEYIERHSLWVDLKILILTFIELINKSRASSEVLP